jgi:type VI secretion system protein ImpL
MLLAKGEDVVANLQNVRKNSNSTAADAYIALNDVYKQYLELKSINESKPWYFRMGIYHGDRQIEPLEKVLLKSMERDFLLPVASMLERKLNDYGQRWRTLKSEAELAKLHADYYETLKVYLMLSNPKHLNNEEALPLLQASWQSLIVPNNLFPNQELKNAYEGNSQVLIGKYLDHMRLPSDHVLAAAHWRVNKDPVRLARTQLRTPPNAEVLYTQIIKKSENQLKPLELRYALKSRGSSYLSNEKTLPGIFTRKGWEDYASREFKIAVHMASYGDWVLGNDEVPDVGDSAAQEANKGQNGGKINVTLAKDLEQQMRQRYFADYVNKWYEFLSSIEIQKDRSIADTANKMVLFAQADGPVAEVFTMIDTNINLEEVNWLADDDNPRNMKKVPLPGQKVAELERPFKDMRRFSSPAEKMPVSEILSKYLVALAALQGEFEQLRNTSESSREAELIAANILSGKGNTTAVFQAWQTTTGLINGSESRTRQVVEPLFMAPIKDSWRVVMGSAVGEIQNKWDAIVVAEYEQRIRGRFPFDQNGPDSALEDVAEFFHPDDGVLWTFVRDQLGAYIYRRNNEWHERSWMGLSPGFNRNLVYALNRSQLITDGLFKRGSSSPEMTFYLYPMPTPGISEITLETNGQMYRYRNEPQEWRKFQWPGQNDGSGARVLAISEKDNLRAEHQEHGTWGIFHLFRKANLVQERGTQYTSEWNMESINGKPIRVSFKVKADRSNNLLQPGLFSEFYIPKKIFGAGDSRQTGVAAQG